MASLRPPPSSSAQHGNTVLVPSPPPPPPLPSSHASCLTSRGGVLDPDAAKPTLDIDPYAKSERLGRPMSPHLTIAHPSMTFAGASIWQRFTGCGLTGLFYFGSIWYGVAPYSPLEVVAFAHSMPSAVIFAGKAILAGPIVFHSVNGVRHLFWDTATGLRVKTVDNTGTLIFGVTVVGTVALAMQ
ncbi:cytochrome b subunit of succinate dehydrogenase, Sdh3p [Thoreauomyces humboldtii]|nr:cytochrome b subunit of succinate dehydrogenase, Sdh3p [Thoreauomyces humboldtii]